MTYFEEVLTLASAITATPVGFIATPVGATPVDVKANADSNLGCFLSTIGHDFGAGLPDSPLFHQALQGLGLLMVEDAREDVRFAENSLVTGAPFLRFCACVPLLGEHDAVFAFLFVGDVVPKTLSEVQRKALDLLVHRVRETRHGEAIRKRLQRSLEENVDRAVKLERSRDLFRSVMNHGPFASFLKDAEGRLLFYNSRYAKRFFITEEEWLGRADDEVWPKDLASRFREEDATVHREQTSLLTIETYRSQDNSEPIYWRTCKFPIRGENGDAVLAGISIDVTQDVAHERELELALRGQQSAMDALEANRTLLRSFHDNSPYHAYIKEAGGEYISYNHAFASFYGVDGELWIGKKAEEVLPQAMFETFQWQELEVMTTGRTIETVAEFALPGKGSFVIRSIKFLVPGLAGERWLGGLDIDVTEEVRRRQDLETANRKLEQLARTDALTGLYSRGTFDDRMDREYAITERKNRSLALLVLDIDNFKSRNDRCGHAAGDDALRILGRVLRQLVRSGEVAARIGGEEFAVMLPETSLLEVGSLAQRIHAALADEACASGPIQVSIGVAEKSPATRSWQDLLSQADAAMYVAKRTGKNCTARLVEGTYVRVSALG